MAAPLPHICLQQLETCQGADKAEKATQGISLDQVKHSLQLSGANFKATEPLTPIYTNVKKTLNCLKATNTKVKKIETWGWNKSRKKLVHKNKPAVYLKPQAVCWNAGVQASENALHSQVNMPLNIANSILKSWIEDVQLFKNQNNPNLHGAKSSAHRLDFLLCFIISL